MKIFENGWLWRATFVWTLDFTVSAGKNAVQYVAPEQAPANM